VNPRNLSNTVQLVIIKENTGSNAAGWDFNYEYNIGHAKDPGDGYKSTDPTSNCSLWEIAICRWGMGVAQYRGGLAISTMSSDGTSVIVNTESAHGLKVGQLFELNDMDSLGELSGRYRTTEIIDSDSFKYPAPDGYTPVDEQSVGPNANVGSAIGYELFPDTSSTQLSDSGGSTALVKNSLNSSVLGRYTFSMVGGQVVGFKKPSMGAGVTNAEELAATGGNEMIAFSLALLAISAGAGLIAFSRRNRRISH
jgi:LPXTG-motif cell wall-anchored protein